MTRATKITGLLAGLLVFGYCMNASAQEKEKPAKPEKAEKKAECKVMTIHASNSEGKTDPKLDKLPFLKKAPFNTYKSFSLISNKTYILSVNAPVSLSLPVKAEITGKLAFQGTSEALKELNFKLYLMKQKSKEPEEIKFAVHGEAPFLYVRPFKDGLLLLHFRCFEAK
ncbi:MAG: hypothetical protein ABIJ56_18860 [Pseudomonadota bacterium]